MKRLFTLTAWNSALGDLKMTGKLPSNIAMSPEQIKRCMLANLDALSADSPASRSLHERQISEASGFAISFA